MPTTHVPAFPRPGFYGPETSSEWDNHPQDGMDLRDWFAGQAIGAILQKLDWVRLDQLYPMGENVVPTLAAELAYRLADKMLDAREEPA